MNIQIDGITYNVLETVTREENKTTRPNTYRIMTETGQVAMHNCRRPNGRKCYIVIEYERRNLSDRQYAIVN